MLPNSSKRFKLLSLIVVGIVILAFSYYSMAAKKTEIQAYRVIKTEKLFEIRYYPSATVATIVSNAKSYKDLSSSGFRKLANYIFGGNQDNKAIAMTAPVHMNISDTASSMSFVMPKGYTKENLPKPNEAGVHIETTQDEYVAAIRFGGYASDSVLEVYKKQLANALKESGIAYYGDFRFLGYNAPYDFINRRNEIIVSVHWKE